MVVQALQALANRARRSALRLQRGRPRHRPVLKSLDHRHTLFVVASKTSRRKIETMANAQTAKAWFLAAGGSDVARHFVATSSNTGGGGLHRHRLRLLGLGRWPLLAVVGHRLADRRIAIGADNFRALLAGAHAMDEHFAAAPLARNVPVLLALIDVWYRNFHGFTSRSVAPYHQGLRRLPAHLQQLRWRAMARRGPGWPGVGLWHFARGVGRGRHQWPARLLPDAAPGDRRDPGEFIAVKRPNHGHGGEVGALLLFLISIASCWPTAWPSRRR